MRKTYLFLLLFSVILFTSCSDDDKSTEDDKTKNITLTVNIKNNRAEADLGSIVYILEGFSIYNGGDWTYSKNGSFHSERWGTGWSSTKSAIANENGLAIIKNVSCPKDQSYFTLVIESAFDKDSEKRYFPVAVYNAEGKDINVDYVYGIQIQ